MNTSQIIEFINSNAQAIVDFIPQEKVDVYFFLENRLTEVEANQDSVYQFMFRSYYGMDNKGLTPEFLQAFFQIQNEQKAHHTFDFTEIFEQLRPYRNRKGMPVLPFSLISKMVNMINPEYPVYSTSALKIFGYKKPSDNDIEKRMERYFKQYEFITNTYKEIKEKELLEPTIDSFKRRGVYKPLPGLKLMDFIFEAAGKYLYFQKKYRKKL